FQADPGGYVRQLVGSGRPESAELPAPGVKDRIVGAANKLDWKARAREHWDKTLDRLMLDLRIFSGSNLVAALLAGGLAWGATGRRIEHLMLPAIVLLVSVGFGVYMYVDRMSYFRILMGLYLGWTYPVFLALIFLRWYQIGRELTAAPAGASTERHRAKVPEPNP
ncbi:MAG TPA: hypothetical protein VEA69_20260, partial [Tepidisphaeraceae bacterium]|nr:hypothetical protein [Tepidisphaeraceae bacterium]